MRRLVTDLFGQNIGLLGHSRHETPICWVGSGLTSVCALTAFDIGASQKPRILN